MEFKMENIEVKKVVKPLKKKSTSSALRVSNDTKRALAAELTKINKKDFGRKVKADQLLKLLLTLIKPEHIKGLQEQSLANADRLEMQYREFVKRNGDVSKDEFLGKLLSGQINTSTNEKIALSEVNLAK